SGALALLRNRNRPRKRRRIRKLRLLALLAVLGVLGLSSFTFGMLTAFASQVAALDPNHQHVQQENTYVYASDGHTILAVLRGSEARVRVKSLNDISPWMRHAIIAIEDKRFYEHKGIDLHGILRAVWADVTQQGEVQGGSTITQQFVKNAINGNAPTINRKLKEAALAWKLEQVWPKDKILLAYLNTIYFGNGAYGVEEASHVYFGHSAKNLDPAEAALLAGIPEDPTLYDPVAHPQAAKLRRNLVLKQMYLQAYLSKKEYLGWLRKPMPKPSSVKLPATQGQKAQYFANYVTGQLVAKYGKKVYGGGYKVTTTIDLGLQKLAQQAIAKALPPSIGPTAALVSIDVHTGDVVAMVGGRNYRESQFNLATQGERQPGSAFKPFVLAAALKAGISPATTLVSHPVTIDAGGRLWNVDNFEHENLGPIDLSKAIAYSDNTVFAQLTNLVGPTNVADVAAEMGITTPLNGYFSIGLGSEPATPLEMARAYTTLADGGFRLDGSLFGNEPLAITSVNVPHGTNNTKTYYNYTHQKPIPWLDNGNAAIEDQMLRGVVQYGTGTAAQLPDWDVAGKTGTTENYGDAWFVGFTPDLVTAVWVGYPNKLVPMTTEFHGHTVEGGTYPALIWKAFMQAALPYRKYTPSSFPDASIPYSTPATVIFRQGKIELDNGHCTGSQSIQFFEGSAPTSVAPCKVNEVDVPHLGGETLASAEAQLTGQPLEYHVVYRTATPGQPVGIVVGQSPRNGTLSAYDTVDLYVARPSDGVVPRVVGMQVATARAALARLKLGVVVSGNTAGRVIAQSPRAGVAAAPGLKVTLKTRRA
ncbi:MAG TPA: PBP1A family penicillin-binding protein, partial [Gaiellaceae bacterium]|nr:PBP1A family penicillin-binding protein [Gaiellaceae bacterium]